MNDFKMPTKDLAADDKKEVFAFENVENFSNEISDTSVDISEKTNIEPSTETSFDATSETPCDNCVLWDENDQLKEKVQEDLLEINALKKELDEYKSAEEKTKKRLLNSNMEADRITTEALYKYHVELKLLKQFVDKYKKVFEIEQNSEKAAIIDILTDFLRDIDADGYLYKAKEKVEIIENAVLSDVSVKESDDVMEEYHEFNLDEAINPTEELDLKGLLEELGVFGDK